MDLSGGENMSSNATSTSKETGLLRTHFPGDVKQRAHHFDGLGNYSPKDWNFIEAKGNGGEFYWYHVEIPKENQKLAVSTQYLIDILCPPLKINDILTLVRNGPAFCSHVDGALVFRSASAMLIQEVLPVVRYEELAGEGQHLGDNCAVCLYEFEAAEEVRRLTNCRHIYHRGCLDRWMEHDQRTCPLCRTPLIPEEMQDSLSDRLWAAAGVPDSFYDYYYSSFPSPPSPTLLVDHQLLSS